MQPVTPLPPFWMLVEDHGGELLVHARRLAPDAAEDVLQEALLRALRAYPRLAHGEHLRAWLYRITTNVALDHHGRAARRHEVPLDGAPEPVVEDPGDVGAFDALVAPLAPAARAAVTLRFVEDLPYEVIATRLDCSPDAARQRVSSAVRDLRRRLA